ncbi:unnamed protein product [Rhodiola kirilowii]
MKFRYIAAVAFGFGFHWFPHWCSTWTEIENIQGCLRYTEKSLQA